MGKSVTIVLLLTKRQEKDMNNQIDQNNQSTPSTQKSQYLFLPQHGHYRHLRVYKVAEILYDLTYMFCQRFLPQHGDRTVDQMIQAARSGKQNIAEGNQAASTSTETEIKLTNVAKASIEELLADYEDYLRTRSLEKWDTHHQRFAPLRQWTRTKDFLDNGLIKASRMSAEEMANLRLTLCHQTIYMLTQLLKTQQSRFVTQGGIREQMHSARTGYRQGIDKEITELRAENVALKQRIAQLEKELRDNQSIQITQITQSTPMSPNNVK